MRRQWDTHTGADHELRIEVDLECAESISPCRLDLNAGPDLIQERVGQGAHLTIQDGQADR